MPVKINLLKNRHTLTEKEYQQEQKYYRYSIMVITVSVVVALILSGWQFILTRNLNSLEKQFAQYTKDLQGLAQANAKQLYLKSRLKLISNFMTERSVSRQALQKIFSLDLPGVSVSSATFEGDNTLHIQATAKDVIVFGQMVEYFSKDSGFFLQVVSKGVSRLEDGAYQMDLLLTLPKT